MTKTKVKIVGDLITTCIFQRTLTSTQVFEVFDPYIEFSLAQSPDAFSRSWNKESPTDFTMTDDTISIVCRELGLIKFKIDKKFKKIIRTFSIDSQVRYSVWISNSFKYLAGEHIESKLIFRQGVMVVAMPSGPGMYHFLREMRKVMPTCISDLEKLMFTNL